MHYQRHFAYLQEWPFLPKFGLRFALKLTHDGSNLLVPVKKYDMLLGLPLVLFHQCLVLLSSLFLDQPNERHTQVYPAHYFEFHCLFLLQSELDPLGVEYQAGLLEMSSDTRS